MILRARKMGLWALVGLVAVSFSPLGLHTAAAQPTYDDAAIAQAAQSMSPVPPDIALPTSEQLQQIGYHAQRLNDPMGNYFRLRAYEGLIAVVEETFGPDHPLTGRLLLAYARQLTSAQDYSAADEATARGSRIVAARLPATSPSQLLARYARIDLLNMRGKHLEQLVATDELIETVARDYAGNEDAALSALDARVVALFRLGRYGEAVSAGREILDRTIAHVGAPSARVTSAVAGQILNLVGAGRLTEAEQLLAQMGASDTLDPFEDRFSLARLYRAKAAIREAKLDYAGARAELEKAHAIFSAREFKLPDAPLDPDYATIGATRVALDMGRLFYRRHHVLGMASPGWMEPVYLKVEIEGQDYLDWRADRDEPWVITDRLQAMVARNNALDNQRSSRDLDKAEAFWRALIAFEEQGTGKDSVVVAASRLDLAETMLRNYKPFAAQSEAEAALPILESGLDQGHPHVIRAKTIIATALARAGRLNLANQAMDEALDRAYAAGELAKADLLRLLTEKDALLRVADSNGPRQRLWDQWGARLGAINTYDAFEQTELRAQTLLAMAQIGTDTGQCPSDAEAAQFREAAASLRITLPGGGEPFIPSQLLYTSLLADQSIAEILACGNAQPQALREFLQAQLNSRADAFANEDGQAMVARYDRWANLLINDPEFGISKEVTDLAMIFQSRAEAIAKNQIEYARSGSIADDSDARQRRVLASEGVGFNYRYALETRLRTNWRFKQEQEALEYDDPGRIYNFNISRADGFDEAFEAAQLIRLDGNSQALARASARAAAPNDALRGIVSEYQRLSAELFQLLDKGGGEDGDVASVQARHAALAARIEQDFPAYHEFAAPKPLSASDAIGALQEGEGLLMVLTVGEDVYVFAVNDSLIRPRAWHRIKGGAQDIADMIATLRCDLDPIECGAQSAIQARGAPSEAELAEWEGYEFNRNIAWELYDTLIRPVAHVFEGDTYTDPVKRLFVVTSGAVSALPLSVLLTEAPSDDGFDTMGSVFRDAPWLSNRFDIAYLPSVADLTGTARTRAATQGFVGLGDPNLAPPANAPTKGQRGSALFVQSRGSATPLADPAALKKMQSLPGAEAELAAVASLFEGKGRLVTKGKATEPAVRSDGNLAGAEVILFSTHGVLPDARSGFAEAGLVLTPPDTASVDDDGLLSASEAAALDFTSDLLVLSACNTATAGSLAGADSLSGLARSFIFAGARSVYASHWRVSDDITKELILAAIDIALKQPELTRSEALGKAMQAIRTGRFEDGRALEGWNPDWSHPSAWAPFVAITSLQSADNGERDY